MDYRNVALEAIAEAVNILELLARVDCNPTWLTGGIPMQRLNTLAESLGYPNARAIHDLIVGDRVAVDEHCHLSER